MKSQIAIYDTHEKAVKAIKVLDEKHFPIDNVTLLGSAEIIEDHIRIKSFDFVKKAPALIGMAAGALIGLFSGLGFYSIPGLAFLYEAGAFVGAVGGFGLGMVAGSFISFFVFISVKEDKVFKSEEHIKEGKFRVVLNGSEDEIERAAHILHTEGTHLELVS
jgi:hypothetical protein